MTTPISGTGPSQWPSFDPNKLLSELEANLPKNGDAGFDVNQLRMQEAGNEAFSAVRYALKSDSSDASEAFGVAANKLQELASALKNNPRLAQDVSDVQAALTNMEKATNPQAMVERGIVFGVALGKLFADYTPENP
jgi:hypothetical protein